MTVEAANDQGTYPAWEFLKTLDLADQKKMQVMFDRMAATGSIANRERFKKIEDDLWEFKSHQIRMPCFFKPGRKLYVTHGFIKKQNKIPKEEIERARRIMARVA